jgi:hypothetical protein
MKYAFLIVLFACLGYKKVLIEPLPVLHRQGLVYEGDYTNPLAGVTVTSAVCKRSGTHNCDADETLQVLMARFHTLKRRIRLRWRKSDIKRCTLTCEMPYRQM